MFCFRLFVMRLPLMLCYFNELNSVEFMGMWESVPGSLTYFASHLQSVCVCLCESVL